MKHHPISVINTIPFKGHKSFYTTEARSKAMSRIRGKNTKSEIPLRKALWGLGIRYRKNDPRLPGKPDIVIQKYRLAIFIDGEFWHGYNWEKKKMTIKSNSDFWIAKIERNMRRDNLTNSILTEMGWTVLRLWDQDVKKEFGICLKKILIYIESKEYHLFPLD